MTRISVRGVKDPKQRKLFKDATKHILNELVSPRMNLEIEINITNLMETDYCFGQCEWMDDYIRPREFCIRIDNTQKLREQLRTLAHELVHTRQYARAELYDYQRTEHTRWRNTIGDYTKTEYRKLPWEVEAYKLQTPLLRKFLKEKNINLKDYEHAQISVVVDGTETSE